MFPMTPAIGAQLNNQGLLTSDADEIARLENLLSQLQLGINRSQQQGYPGVEGLQQQQTAAMQQLEQLTGSPQAGQAATNYGGLLTEQVNASEEIAALEQERDRLRAAVQRGGSQPSSSDSQSFQTSTFQSSMSPEQLGALYATMAAGADDPTEIGMDYARRMQTGDQLRYNRRVSERTPSNIREWEYYNSLSDEDKKAYLEMKRGVSLQNIAGSLQSVYSPGLRDPRGVGEGGDVYATAEQQFEATRREAEASGMGAANATRYATLSQSRGGRQLNLQEAQRLRGLLGEGELNPGQYRQLLHLVWNDADMQALDALAEFAARARLKANGETRPTDADVEGMKRALFGAGRTEEFTGQSLERLIIELEGQEREYQQLGTYLQNPLFDIQNQPNDTDADSRADGRIPPGSRYEGMTREQLIEEANRQAGR